jgi:hypothetical protein
MPNSINFLYKTQHLKTYFLFEDNFLTLLVHRIKESIFIKFNKDFFRKKKGDKDFQLMTSLHSVKI